MEDEKVIVNEEQTPDEPTAEPAEVGKQIEEELIPYEYGDASIYCHVCGKETAVNHPGFLNVNGGVTIPLTANNKSHLTLSCGHCGAALTLHFVSSVNPPIKDAEVISEDQTNNENLQEENKEKESV